MVRRFPNGSARKGSDLRRHDSRHQRDKRIVVLKEPVWSPASRHEFPIAMITARPGRGLPPAAAGPAGLPDAVFSRSRRLGERAGLPKASSTSLAPPPTSAAN